jgi:hypothetical protein
LNNGIQFMVFEARPSGRSAEFRRRKEKRRDRGDQSHETRSYRFTVAMFWIAGTPDRTCFQIDVGRNETQAEANDTRLIGSGPAPQPTRESLDRNMKCEICIVAEDVY